MIKDPSKLDTTKFQSVHTMMLKGATEGERNAAKAAAERLAQKAGMTVDEAIALAVNKNVQEPAAQSTARNPFEEMFNTPEFRKEREERAKREAAEREELLKRYGSEEAIFEETEQERLLSAAVEHLKDWKEGVTANGETYRCVCGLAGQMTFYDVDRIPKPVIAAVRDAYHIPSDLRGVLKEYQQWSELYHARYLFAGVDHWYWVEARDTVLRNILDTRPVQNWQDLRARMDWWAETLTLGSHHSDGWEEDFLKRIAEDHEILQHQSTVKNGHASKRRTNADKATDVIDLIRAHPDASARDLARRAGVSPQTILNWRQKLHAA